jgi:hypothetical protein
VAAGQSWCTMSHANLRLNGSVASATSCARIGIITA